MAYAFFKIGGAGVADGEADELNKFLRAHRILSIDKRFVERVDGVHWYFCVEYLDAAPGKRAMSGEPGGKGSSSTRVDYKEILSEKDFEIFLALRALRKELAEKEKAPVYTVFTNEQLAQMVQGKVVSKSALEGISGVGPARVSKYGEAFLKILKEKVVEDDATDRQPESENPGADEPASGVLEGEPGEAT